MLHDDEFGWGGGGGGGWEGGGGDSSLRFHVLDPFLPP